MLIDTRKQPIENNEGFNPNVQNQQIYAKARTGQKIALILFCVFTLGIYYFVVISKKNWFNQIQMQINEATSNIDVQLAKRKDVLIKLVDATKSSLSFEKDLLKEVTELRNVNMNPSAHNQAKTIKNEQMLNSAFGKLMATFENYPNIKSTDTIVNLMQTADYIEREIAASRRLYNSVVSQFNQKLYVFPDVIPAARLKLCNLPLFIASASQREDVSLKL